jgi:formate hydrogenlyase transcriptional activator
MSPAFVEAHRTVTELCWVTSSDCRVYLVDYEYENSIQESTQTLNLRWWRWTAMSSTIQKPAESAVIERYEALFRVSQTLISIHSSEELFSILARELRAVVNFYVMGVGIYDEKAHEMDTKSYGEPGLPLQAPKFAPEETFSWWVYQHQQPLIIPSLDAETRFPAVAEMLKNRGVRSVCALPLTTAHRRLGGLAVGSTEVDAYSKEEVSFLSLVANQVALAVDDALNFDASHQAKEALRASEQGFRLIVDSIPGLVHTTTAEGVLEFVNRQLLDYFGKTLDELKGWATNDIIHPDDRSHVIAAFTRSIETGQAYEIEQRCRRNDGAYRWFHVRALAVRDTEGRIIRWYTLFTDIDERKQAEEALRQDERELRQLLDFLPQHVMVLDADGHLLEANQMVLDYTGDTLEEMRIEGAVGLVDGYIHPDDLERVQSECQRGLSSGAPFEIERRARGKDGRYRWFLFRHKPLLDKDGRVARWFVTATDIEERKQEEEGIRKENIALREEIVKASMFEEIVGASPALQAVLDRVAKVAPTDSTVLITGETGTGKELIARAIHKRSARSARAFVSVNCAAIPPALIPSELFGHEKGAFTGATQRRLGRFELAEGGTIFLDEIGELSAETQVALLRVLQEHEFERVGGNRSIKANVRVIVATNRDLEAAMTAETFRRDLFYRLNVFPIEMPPLRERREDIPLLVEYFIDRFARKAGKKIRRVSKKTLELLQSYPWPGNIRELQNVIERSVIVCEGEDFSVDESWLSRQPVATELRGQVELSQRLAAHEKEAIEVALRESGGRVFGPSGAAVRLGIPRSTLESKIRSLKIDKNRFKITDPSKHN